MPIDPNTGMYSTQVSYQPTGALGAVTELLNAGKAQDIANALQQQRAAQASLEQQHAQEYAAEVERQNQSRAAQAALPDTATADQRVAAATPYENFKDFIPYMSRTAGAAASAAGREAVGANTAYGKALLGLTQLGYPEPVARQMLDSNPSMVRFLGQGAGQGQPSATSPAAPQESLPTQGPADIAGLPGSAQQGPVAPGGMENPYMTQPAPVAGAKAAALTAGANKANVVASDIQATQKSRIDLNVARAANQYADAALARYRASGQISAKDGLQLWKVAAYYDDMARKAESDPVFLMLNPGAQAELAAWKQKSSAVWQAATASGVKPPPGIVPPGYTPFAGAGAAPATGNAVPGGETRSIIMPPKPAAPGP